MKPFKISILIALLLTIFACEEEIVSPEAGPAFSISAFEIPAVINISVPRFYTLMFRVTHPEGLSAISEVKAVFYQSNQVTKVLELTLFDDGQAQNENDGDVVANDGIYTATLFAGGLQPIPADVKFVRGEAVDASGMQIESEFITSQILSSIDPILQSVSTPDTLLSATAPVTFSATVQDSNEIDDVTFVLMQLKRNGVGVGEDTLRFSSSTATDRGEFTITIDSTYAAERQGEYTLEFQAHDRAGGISNTLTKSIFLENKSPQVSNSALPDTVQRPVAGEDIIEVRVSANDPQGLGDIQTVTMVILRQGGTPATVELFDDGDFAGHRDETAGDGVFSRGLTVDQSSTPGTFSFTFQAADRVGNLSSTIVDTLVILP